MALGARKRDIARQFLLEAAVLSLVGGCCGLLAGTLVTWGVRALVDFPARITPGIVIASLTVAVLVGLAAGFLPARRAANLAVIDALRAE
jgi:putative ABC transport system permease protein